MKVDPTMADGYGDPYWSGGFYGPPFPYGTPQSAFPSYGAAGQQQTATPTTYTTPATSHSSSSNATSTATPHVIVDSEDEGSDHIVDSEDGQVSCIS